MWIRKKRRSKVITMTNILKISLLVIAGLLIYFISFYDFTPEPKFYLSQGNPVSESQIPEPTIKKDKTNILNAWFSGSSTPSFSTLGSSVTAGSGVKQNEFSKTWLWQLFTFLRSQQGMSTIKYTNNGFSGYSTQNIIDSKKVDVIVLQNPNLVIFETCVINDFGRNIPVEQTIKNIDAIVQELSTKLPNAKIILQSPNPIRDMTTPNNTGSTYEDYISKTRDHILSKGWSYIDIFEGMQQQMKADGKSIEDILSDNVHPNEVGYKYWYNTQRNFFSN